MTDPRTEPPALAVLLVQRNRRRLASIAAYATMLDLVARGVLIRDEAAGTIRAARAHPDLLPFEKHVFDTVTSRAAGGTAPVPLAAVDLGSERQADEWRDRFLDLLGAAGRTRGLVKERVPMGVRVMVWLAYVAACGSLIAVTWSAGYAFLVVLGGILLAQPLRGMARLVPHGRGVELAAYYRRNAGAGPRKEVAPFIGGQGEYAWSQRGGVWHRVNVVSGKGLAFGSSPRGTLWMVPAGLPFFAAWLILLCYFTSDLTFRRVLEVWPPLFIGLGWLVWIAGVAYIGRLVARAIYDLTHPARVLTGPVIQLVRASVNTDDGPDYEVAIDDGSGVAVRHRVGVALFTKLRKDTWLRLEVTPKLGYLRAAQIVPSYDPDHGLALPRRAGSHEA